MLHHQFYPVVSLKESAFRNPETVRSENYISGKFLALDLKEVQNEYHVIFVDDKKDLQVFPVNKVRFEGFVSAADAMEFLPKAFVTMNTKEAEKIATNDEVPNEEQPVKRGRKPKE